MPPSLLGAFGAALILLAFIFNQLRVWREDYFIYDFANFVGGLMMVVYALLISSFPFAVLNGVWALVSLRDCITDIRRNRARTKRGFFEKWGK